MPYANVVIPDLTDAELIDRQVTVAEPLALPNVTEGAPPEDISLTYVGQYQVGESIKCALGHWHKKGYAFTTDDGRHYLIGHVCGKRDFGMGTWEHFVDDRKRMEDRIYYLRAVRDLDEAFRTSRDWFTALPAHPVTRWLDTTQDMLAQHTRMFNKVRDLVLRGEPTLFVLGTERDFDAEEREREAAVRNGKPLAQVPHIMRRVAKPIGILQGGALFTKRRLFAKEMTKTALAIGAFLDRGTADLSTRDLRTLTETGKALLRSVADLKEAAIGAVAFFGPANLVNFAAWTNAKAFDGTRFVARGRVLEGLDTWNRVVLRLQPPATMFDFAEFDQLVERGAGWAGRIEAATAARGASGRRAEKMAV